MKKRKGKAPKSKKKLEATIMTPVAELLRSETNVHYNAVLIEEIRSSQKFIIEYVDGALSAFRAEVNARFDALDKRLDSLLAYLSERQSDMHKAEPRLDNHDDRLAALENTPA